MSLRQRRPEDVLDEHAQKTRRAEQAQPHQTNDSDESPLAPINRRRPPITRSWINLSIMLILLGLFLRNYALLVLPVLLLTVIGAAAWWNAHVLDAVTFRRAFRLTRLFPGETTTMDIWIENAKFLPVPWLEAQDSWPVELPVAEASSVSIEPQSINVLLNLYSLRWYERVQRSYVVFAAQRGMFTPGPTQLRAGDIFGLFQDEQNVELPNKLIVYPQIKTLEELGLPPKEPLGDQRARYQLFQDPSRTMGARDLQPGDSFRHIHWPATARRQTLQTRVYEPTTTSTAVICLNVATMPKPWQGILPGLLEEVIVVAASLASYAIESRYAVGLIANGAVPRSDRSVRVMPGRAPDQLLHILESLAAITGFATAAMDKFLLSESPGLPWGATLVVVTGVLTAELLATLRQLQSAGRRIVLITLAAEPPQQVPGMLIHHIPSPEAPHYDEELWGLWQGWTG